LQRKNIGRVVRKSDGGKAGDLSLLQKITLPFKKEKAANCGGKSPEKKRLCSGGGKNHLLVKVPWMNHTTNMKEGLQKGKSV